MFLIIIKYLQHRRFIRIEYEVNKKRPCAALIDIGYGLIEDLVSQLCWLQIAFVSGPIRLGKVKSL